MRLKFEVARQASSPSLCASVRALPLAHEAQQQLSPLDTYDCEIAADVFIFRVGLLDAPGTDPQKLRLKFEVTRQASSPSLCASVRAVPLAHEVEQQLSPLDSYGCELPADGCIF